MMLFAKKAMDSQSVRERVESCMSYTLSPATRACGDDLERIKMAVSAIGVRVSIEKFVPGIMYQYCMKPSNLADYQKLTSSKSQKIFAAAFGSDNVRLCWEGQHIILEVPGADDRSVNTADVLRNDQYYTAKGLKVAVGLKMDRTPVLMDLEKAPHVLIGGETGSGKSILMHQMIISLLLNHTPDEVQIYMVDPKRTELSMYAPLRNVSVVYDAESAVDMLHDLCIEMDKRYKLISRAHVRDIDSYNQKAFRKMSRKVVFIDELSDLMSRGLKKQTEAYIVRLAQLARACGIHLVIATQRPDRSVVTGMIKDNIPTRICLSVSSGINSRIILDRMGGEKLSGKGDLLYLANGAREVVRCQCGYISESEIENVVRALR